MKYIIDIPNELAEATARYWNETTDMTLAPYTEPDSKTIEDEVWEFLAFLIDEMDVDDKYNCFNQSSAYRIVSTMSYQEAKSKYEAWLKQKDETFNTGDEVYNKEIDSKGVILRRYNSDTLDILWDNGSAGETIGIKAITKTGRHFDEVSELLEKMRGEE